jgi:hypothetical protein
MNITRAAETRSHAVSPAFTAAGGAGAGAGAAAGAPAAFSTAGAALSAARAGAATPAARKRAARQSRIAEVLRGAVHFISLWRRRCRWHRSVSKKMSCRREKSIGRAIVRDPALLLDNLWKKNGKKVRATGYARKRGPWDATKMSCILH